MMGVRVVPRQTSTWGFLLKVNETHFIISLAPKKLHAAFKTVVVEECLLGVFFAGDVPAAL